MYILYGGDFTRAPLVRWVMDEGGMPYEYRAVDILKGEHMGPTFRALNPAGFVPVLVTPEGEPLHEVAALMLYLADRHGLTELAPHVADPDRGPFLAAFFYVADEIQPDIKRFHFPQRYAMRREDDLAVQQAAKSMVLGKLGAVAARLERRGPLTLGERFSMADFYLAFWIAYLDHEAACLTYPAIARLYERVKARPGAGDCIAETERAAAAYARMQAAKPGGVIP